MQILIEISERFAEEFKDLMDKGATFPFYIDARGATLLSKHHGRLIDGDALRRSFQESIESCHKWAEKASDADDDYMYARISQSLGTFVEASLRTKAQPTIIEATESEVNEHENSD